MVGKFWGVVAGTVVAVLLVLVLGVVAFIYSGVYNVAATDPHLGIVRWALSTTQARSVRARGEDVADKPPFDAALVSHGFDHFDAMCVECHGAPGVERGEYGKGLNPEPPELSEEAAEFSDAELFWITKHGIKFTGMPAFGPTHSDEEIWGLVAFLRRLEDMSAEDYGRLAESGDTPADSAQPGGHGHAPGAAEHSH